MAENLKIELFVKASDDGESIGNCPFCHRIFMTLMLKGAPFTLTTIDLKRAPEVLKNLAPGSQPPFLLYNGEVKTDTNKIEEFLEEMLAPPNFPYLAPRYKESYTAGNDIFHKFSAYIKNPVSNQDDALQKNLLRSLLKLDKYLCTPLEYELKSEPQLQESRRKFLDGDTITLADCSLLPKLHIIRTVCKYYRQFDIPKDLKGVSRYLSNTAELKEFKYTCPSTEEILLFYRTMVRPQK
ncbi:chloride intracellular channel protein 3 [Rhinatrema bivittatum]|uniref:chloride intracellular channel protein 3 n=1 Tax=Rhinatrema bivittatum TaxID=194408 RepID=UPI001128C2DD|nr:chloride intracellular channel protein 3 [Rhinatrema bivittatum]